MNEKRNNAFTIVEMLVAMALAIIVMGLTSVIFARAVTAFRKAGATIEITRRADAICQQLTSDFRGLRKDGEIFLAWVAAPEIDEQGIPVTPTRYQKFDRIVFFADGNFQTYNPQPSSSGLKQVTGNLARISYVPAKDNADTRAAAQKDRKLRILSRTQHIVTADTDFNAFPDLTAVWNPADFETKNSDYEYQTMTMADWTNLSNPPLTATNPNAVIKNNILTILSDIPGIFPIASTITEGGPVVDKSVSNTLHNYLAEGVGQFGIQIWRNDENRWYPQMDSNGDGDYSDGDYPTTGTDINYGNVDGILYNGTGEGNFGTMKADVTWVPLKFTALKFTFTLYDSKGLFPEGRTFTHVVMINE